MNHFPAIERPSKARLYWAYGSNLCAAQMKARCPESVMEGPLTMRNLILRFRMVADVAYFAGAVVPGGLWWITPECEASLDDHEGAAERGGYHKQYFTYADPASGRPLQVLYYKTN